MLRKVRGRGIWYISPASTRPGIPPHEKNHAPLSAGNLRRYRTRPTGKFMVNVLVTISINHDVPLRHIFLNVC